MSHCESQAVSGTIRPFKGRNETHCAKRRVIFNGCVSSELVLVFKFGYLYKG